MLLAIDRAEKVKRKTIRDNHKGRESQEVGKACSAVAKQLIKLWPLFNLKTHTMYLPRFQHPRICYKNFKNYRVKATF